MQNKYSSPRVMLPRSISEALEIAGNEKDAVFWAGGTWLGSGSKNRSFLSIPRTIISLGHVEELTKASRSEHALELGSMMTLDRLAAIGVSALPPGLSQALSQIGSRPLRCRATIGGHLAMKNRIGDLRPLLQLLETKIETRFLREVQGRRKPSTSVRKFPLARFGEDGFLQQGELITRIRIPTENWNYGSFIKIHPGADPNRLLIFTALARVDKGVLSEWRMALSDGIGGILRDRDMEVNLAGRPLPLNERELDGLDAAIEKMTSPWNRKTYERVASRRMARGFLDRASE